jgi:hypothetical protein
MGDAKLLEVPDDKALQAMELLLRKYSKQGEAAAVTLTFTGKRFRDILELEGLTTRPHYEITGFLDAELNAKAEAVRLLTGGHTQILLNLYYSWGVFPLFLRSATSSGKGSLIIDFDPPSRGWFLQSLLAGLMPILGVEEAVTGPIPGDGELVVTSFANASREGIHLLFPSKLAGRVEEFLRELVARLNPPEKMHVILTTDLKTLRELQESGKVVPCNCCVSHFDYVNLLAEESDVDTARLGEVTEFLAKRLGRERALTFRGFTWNWEEGFDPARVNAVMWSIPKRGPGWIKVRWYDEEPPPRGTVATMRKDLEQLLDGLR